ncbi:MAG: MXAN_5187 C-terminal domain-containing protein [Terriglobia bacterium]
MAQLTIDEQLNQLEKDLRQLQIEYDRSFAGGRKRPPNETEWRVQTAIKRMAERGGRLKYAHTFRFNGLAARYAKFSEIWRRRARSVEAGHSAVGYSQGARELEKQRLEEASRQHEALLHGQGSAIRFGDPAKETEQMQSLYRSMLEARKAAGDSAKMNFEQFHKFVRQKTEQLKKQLSCKQVEYSVSVESGRVRLKAKGV